MMSYSIAVAKVETNDYAIILNVKPHWIEIDVSGIGGWHVFKFSEIPLAFNYLEKQGGVHPDALNELQHQMKESLKEANEHRIHQERHIIKKRAEKQLNYLDNLVEWATTDISDQMLLPLKGNHKNVKDSNL